MTAEAPHIDRIVEAFEFLDDWEERFAYLIDLGRKLPPMDPAEKTEANRVHGCQATVYLTTRLVPGDPPTIEVHACSDAHIVNGLIAILLSLYSGKTPAQILAVDVEGVVRKLGLAEHLSPTRRNGLFAMIQRIRELAARRSPA